MDKTRKLVIVGDSAFAEIAREYFDADTGYEVVAFAVETPFLKRETLHGLPVLPFETLEERLDPARHDVFVACTYTQLNRLRQRLAADAKARGYKLASYVSPRAFVWKNVELGEHCFVFEDNTVQPFVTLGSNLVLWSGNHIGHHSVIKDHVLFTSHVVLSGHCVVESFCFLGVNATVRDKVHLAEGTLVAMSASVTRNTEAWGVYEGVPAQKRKVSSKDLNF